MANITFDNTDGDSGWKWHYGNVKQDGKDYPVTVLEMYDSNSDSYSFEITWVEETPANAKELEEEILSKF